MQQAHLLLPLELAFTHILPALECATALWECSLVIGAELIQRMASCHTMPSEKRLDLVLELWRLICRGLRYVAEEVEEEKAWLEIAADIAPVFNILLDLVKASREIAIVREQKRKRGQVLAFLFLKRTEKVAREFSRSGAGSTRWHCVNGSIKSRSVAFLDYLEVQLLLHLCHLELGEIGRSILRNGKKVYTENCCTRVQYMQNYRDRHAEESEGDTSGEDSESDGGSGEEEEGSDIAVTQVAKSARPASTVAATQVRERAPSGQRLQAHG